CCLCWQTARSGQSSSMSIRWQKLGLPMPQWPRIKTLGSWSCGWIEGECSSSGQETRAFPGLNCYTWEPMRYSIRLCEEIVQDRYIISRLIGMKVELNVIP